MSALSLLVLGLELLLDMCLSAMLPPAMDLPPQLLEPLLQCGPFLSTPTRMMAKRTLLPVTFLMKTMRVTHQRTANSEDTEVDDPPAPPPPRRVRNRHRRRRSRSPRHFGGAGCATAGSILKVVLAGHKPTCGLAGKWSDRLACDDALFRGPCPVTSADDGRRSTTLTYLCPSVRGLSVQAIGADSAWCGITCGRGFLLGALAVLVAL